MKFFNVDPELVIPSKNASRDKFPLQIAHSFYPNEEIWFLNYGRKIQERLIFCFNESTNQLLEYHPVLCYNEMEEEKLAELEEYLAEFYSPFNNEEEPRIEIGTFFDRPTKLRFLQANKYKLKQTVENMMKHQEFRDEMIPFKLNDGMMTVLKSGLMYVHGRDK